MTGDRIIWCRDCGGHVEGRVLGQARHAGRDVVALHYDRAGGLCSGSGRLWLTVQEQAGEDWRDAWIPARSQPGSERQPTSAPMSPASARGTR